MAFGGVGGTVDTAYPVESSILSLTLFTFALAWW